MPGSPAGFRRRRHHGRRRDRLADLAPLRPVVARRRAGLLGGGAPVCCCAGGGGGWWVGGAAAALLLCWRRRGACRLSPGGWRTASAPAAARWRVARHHGAAVRVERRPARVEQAVTRVEFVGDDLLGLEDSVAVVVEQNARLDAVAGDALRHDGPAKRIERDDDQRLGLVGRRHALDLESRQQCERRARRERLILRALRRGACVWRGLLHRDGYGDRQHGEGGRGNETAFRHSNLRIWRNPIRFDDSGTTSAGRHSGSFRYAKHGEAPDTPAKVRVIAWPRSILAGRPT